MKDPEGSPLPQCLRRLNPKASPRRPQRREQPHGNHHHRDHGQQHAASPIHESTVGSPLDQRRRQYTYHHPDRELAKRPGKDASHNGVPWRAEGGANPDLALALRDGEGHERIDPGGREEEDADQDRSEYERDEL